MKTLWIVLLFCFPAFAEVFVENFTSITQKESATAVWNFSLGKVHPTLEVVGVEDDAGVVSPYFFDIGDGNHGSFSQSTYSQFATVIGNYITIDANVFPVLKVTSFHLAPGFTLTSINGPLVIFSLGDVVIEGLIECNGSNGADANTSAGGAGGIGRCGGGNGGSGGNALTSGTAGSPTTGSVTGGGGGNYLGIGNGGGGGGGGSYTQFDGSNGTSSAPNTFGIGGSSLQDYDFTFLNSNGGGGGGSGSNSAGGGGGGASGGTIVIHTAGNFKMTTTGNIEAYGGNGGISTNGGGGGGGAGGSVKILSPNLLELQPAAEVIDADGGTGGIPTTGAAGDGGNGSAGRTWLLPFTAFIGPGFESPTSGLVSTGDVLYATTSQQIISKSYDTQSTLAKYHSISANPTDVGLTFEIAGSNDNFVSDTTGFLPLSSITQLDKKRYVKYKVTIANASTTVPLTIDSLSLNYESGLQEEFTFKGCGTIGPQSPKLNGLNIFAMLLVLLIPFLLASRLKLIKTK